MGTGSFPEVQYGRGVLLTPQPLLVPRSWKSRAIPLPTLWATAGPVTVSLSFYLYINIHTSLSRYPQPNFLFALLHSVAKSGACGQGFSSGYEVGQ